MIHTAAEKMREKHATRLEEAAQHGAVRDCWGAYPETPSEKIFGEGSKAAAETSFQNLLGNTFELPGHPAGGTVAGERSPYGFDLEIAYPAADPLELVSRAAAALDEFAEAGLNARLGILLEAQDRLRSRSLDTALEVMHTTGQGYMMAFQAGAAHALDRALEAVSLAEQLQRAVPEKAVWEKPMGKHPPAVLDKTYRTRPRGVALAVGCSTFPTWNGYPGLFASLACGCPVIVKPHPCARLPLAQAVRVLRDVLAEAGLPREIVQLAADAAGRPQTVSLATNPAVKVIDYTGSGKFGRKLEKSAPQARVYAEKSGANCVVVGDFSDWGGMARNLALGLSLYSGQMCTTPQNIFVAKDNFAAVSEALQAGIGKLLSDDARAAEILGAIASPQTLARIDRARGHGRILLDSRKVAHPVYPDAAVRTPLLIKADCGSTYWRNENFGPVAFLIEVPDADTGVALMEKSVIETGALTAGLYADDPDTQLRFRSACARAGVSAGINLTGPMLMNHSAAFSDYHGSGANPSSSASICDADFVAGRFFVFQTRRQSGDSAR